MTISASYPYNLQNGTTADATQVMADFLQIQNDVNANAAHNGANSDITSLLGLTTPLAVSEGGTGATTTAAARTALGLGTAAVENLLGDIIDGAGSLVIKANVALSGSPTTTTQSPGDNSTKISTTAFFAAGITAALNNTALAGVPTAATAAHGTNTTQLATTAFANGGVTGTLSAGTALTVSPIDNVTHNAAHTLGAVPAFLKCRLVCLSGELGYNAGDQIELPFSNNATNAAFTVSADATNVYFAGASAPSIVNRTTNGSSTLTEANWAMVVTPYKLN